MKKEDNAKLPSFKRYNQEKFLNSIRKIYFSPNFSSETVSFFLPLALLDASTLRPLAEAILSRKPCLFFLLRFDGWNVLLVIIL